MERLFVWIFMRVKDVSGTISLALQVGEPSGVLKCQRRAIDALQ